jgi:hypothetical protein
LKHPRLDGNARGAEGETVNISSTGLCMLQHDESDFTKVISAARKKNHFGVEIHATPLDETIAAVGQMIWFDTSKDNHTTRYRTGMFLSHIEKEDMPAWYKLCSYLATQKPDPKDTSKD